MEESTEELAARLNLETGRLAWAELQPHFARGNVIRVGADLDLVNVGVALARDDRASVARWKSDDAVRAATDDDARRWQAANQSFWALVVAPWVLVQESED